MILVAGGTGTLGSRVVRRLAGRGLAIRVMARDPARAPRPSDGAVGFSAGDVRDPAAVRRAVAGARVVVSAIHGFTGPRGAGPHAIDRDGNANLIRAASAAGVERFVLLSVHGAARDHPLELFRMKHAAEQDLLASGLAWTILRPTASMETWVDVLCGPLARGGHALLFGTGRNPINFVAADDVAAFVELAALDPSLEGERVDVAGPENLTMRELVDTFETVTGTHGSRRRIPRPVLRSMSVVMRPVKPALARQAQAAVYMDTHDMTVDVSTEHVNHPNIPRTTLAEAIHRGLVPAATATGGTASQVRRGSPVPPA